MKIYSVHDLASKTYVKPFVFQTDRDAIEGFKYVCNDDETPYSKHSQDFNLVCLGSFDERTGVLSVSTQATCIARAVDLNEALIATSKEL